MKLVAFGLCLLMTCAVFADGEDAETKKNIISVEVGYALLTLALSGNLPVNLAYTRGVSDIVSIEVSPRFTSSAVGSAFGLFGGVGIHPGGNAPKGFVIDIAAGFISMTAAGYTLTAYGATAYLGYWLITQGGFALRLRGGVGYATYYGVDISFSLHIGGAF